MRKPLGDMASLKAPASSVNRIATYNIQCDLTDGVYAANTPKHMKHLNRRKA
jgi:hypothetical protein